MWCQVPPAMIQNMLDLLQAFITSKLRPKGLWKRAVQRPRACCTHMQLLQVKRHASANAGNEAWMRVCPCCGVMEILQLQGSHPQPFHLFCIAMPRVARIVCGKHVLIQLRPKAVCQPRLCPSPPALRPHSQILRRSRAIQRAVGDLGLGHSRCWNVHQ